MLKAGKVLFNPFKAFPYPAYACSLFKLYILFQFPGPGWKDPDMHAPVL